MKKGRGLVLLNIGVKAGGPGWLWTVAVEKKLALGSLLFPVQGRQHPA